MPVAPNYPWLRALQMADFTYDLPEERIAEHPLPERDASRLLVYQNGTVQDSIFRHLPHHLPPDALLVLNDTRVAPARLVFQRSTGARIEVFCLEPLAPTPDVALALASPGPQHWHCLVGNAKRWPTNEPLTLNGTNNKLLTVNQLERTETGFRLQLDWQPDGLSLAELLDDLGRIPLPPYIRRAPTTADQHRYQTVFAAETGAVAAPTAALHFTPALLNDLQAKGIGLQYVTLHVGAGTFKPVTAHTPADHPMHAEQLAVPLHLVQALARHTGPVVAVGTTSLRTLESLYWHALAVRQQQARPAHLQVGQWEPYTEHGYRTDLPPAAELFHQLAEALQARGETVVRGDTQLIILPGYRFQVANGLVTNFHQPGSTLLLLVAAWLGPNWKAVYRHALQQPYRFLSYGDASLLWHTPA